jgi:hypothetical protein
MAADATTIAAATVATTVVVAFVGWLGVNRTAQVAQANAQESTTKDLLINEQKRLDDCHKARADDRERFHTALESIEAERDAQKQRADLLAVEVQQLERPGGWTDTRIDRRRRQP